MVLMESGYPLLLDDLIVGEVKSRTEAPEASATRITGCWIHDLKADGPRSPLCVIGSLPSQLGSLSPHI